MHFRPKKLFRDTLANKLQDHDTKAIDQQIAEIFPWWLLWLKSAKP